MKQTPLEMFSLQSRVLNLYNVFWTHLTTPSIRASMQMLRASFVGKTRHRFKRVTLWDYLIKYRFSRDGFVFSNGRPCQLSVLTCTSIHGGCTSIHTSDPVGIFLGAETTYNLSLLTQMHDVQMNIARAFGIVDPVSGAVIGLYSVSSEDSKSWAQGMGRDIAKSNSRWCFTQYGHEIHMNQWKRFIVS